MALSDSDKIRRIEDHYRSFWHGDIDDFDRQLGMTFVDDDAVPGLPPGVSGAKLWALACRQAGADMRVTVTDALVAGSVVAVLTTWRGRRACEDRSIEVDGIVVWKLDEQGRIVHRTGFIDLPADVKAALVPLPDASPAPVPFPGEVNVDV